MTNTVQFRGGSRDGQTEVFPSKSGIRHRLTMNEAERRAYVRAVHMRLVRAIRGSSRS